MGRNRTSRSARAMAVAATACLTIGAVGAAPASAAPEDEAIWEEGTVTSVADGDTLVAALDAGSGARGSQRLRTIGVQAPETSHGGSPAECGAWQATKRLKAQLPVGSRVQTRSVDVASYDDYSGGRIVRSLYATDEEGNWYDTSRQTISDGWLMWFPLSPKSGNKPEWAHNLEYRVLAEDAANQGRGLWSPNLCGTSPEPGLDVRMWAKYWGTERVYVENNGSRAIDLSGWTIRDSAIKGYRRLPAGTVIPAGGVREVFTGDMNLNNLPAPNAAFQGDAVYLMDNAGSYGTGNLRAWFPYPCNPDACSDPLDGAVKLDLVQVRDPDVQEPSAPGAVSAVASTDGSGRITASWAQPTNLGGYSVTYTVRVTPVDGGAEPTPVTGISGTSASVGGLTLGRAYTVSVSAQNAAGSSPATAPTAPVAPGGLPAAPPAPTVEPRGDSAIVSWQTPAGVAPEPPVQYEVTATPVDPTSLAPLVGSSPATCTTSAGETSCLVTGLTESGTYSTVVRARLDAQSMSSAATTFVAAAAPSGTGAAPTAPESVRVMAGDTRAIVSWTAPDATLSGPITAYRAVVLNSGGDPAGECATEGTTSCVVTGLANDEAHTAVVTATANALESDPSAASSEFSPRAVTTTRSAGPTAAPPAADPWVGGEIVRVSNTSGSTVRLGGYGLWDRYSATGGGSDVARYLFPADQRLAAGASLQLHFGTAPPTKPAAPAGTSWLWTGDGTFVNDDTDEFVELANLNRAQVVCAAPRDQGACRGSLPAAVPSSPVGITARSSAASVGVSWGAPISTGGAPITGYTATAYDAPAGGTQVATCTADGSARTCAFPGQMGRAYYVEVVAHNGQGTSGPSWRVRAVPKTVPGAPGSVSAVSTPGGVEVTWSAAAPNGAQVTSYTAAAYSAATGGAPVATCGTSSGALTTCTIMELPRGTYYFDVTARNRAGDGSPSSPRIAATADAGLTSSSVSKRRVTVRWTPPKDPGAAGVTGYVARIYSKSKGGSYLGSCTAKASESSCRTKKLKKRSHYYIALTVTTTAGSYTVSPRMVTGTPRKPGRPTVTSATPSGRRVVIAWSAPSSTGYAPLTTYQARLYSKKKGGSSRGTCTVRAESTSCTSKSLKGRTYYAAVRVRNTRGWSSWSPRVRVVVR